MTFLLLNLLQARTRLSWVVIVAAVLAFAAGVSLFVYFYKRYKRIEKEPEEDWDLSRRSLFVNLPPPVTEVKEADTSSTVEIESAVAEEVPIQTGGTRAFASDMNLPSFAPETTPEPEPQVETSPRDATPPEIEAPTELRSTKILASPSQIEAVTETEGASDDITADEEVWIGLEEFDQPPVTAEREPPLQSTAEPLNVARVEQRSQREPFEPPRIDRISHREPYEPPAIEPLTPREAAATRELRSIPTPGIEQPSGSHAEEPMARGTVRLGSATEDIPKAVQPSVSGRETRELWGAGTTGVMIPEPSLPTSAAPRARMFGSVLGLPAEHSHQPMILGDPVRPADEMGIGALTNYGKDLGPKGGRAGTIALLLVVVLLAGAAGLYFFVPSVHSRVGAFVGHLRGIDTQAALEAAKKPRAQIIPSLRLDPNKNMVTARGAVDNISDEPLENLSVEVLLKPGGESPPETRTIPVTPNPLPARERGTFEFEYDGKRDTGYAGYTITRLLSNGTEVRFRAPGP